MLNVVAICGDSIENVYVILQQLDWGLGDPHGLAHWNGKAWKWLHRIDNAYLIDMKYKAGCVYMLDMDGYFLLHRDGSQMQKIAQPAIHELSDGTREPWTGFPSFNFIGDDLIGIVGDKGAFFILENDTWRHIETNCGVDFCCIFGSVPECYICGDEGVIVCYDGHSCEVLYAFEGDGLSCVDRDCDGNHFFGVSRRDQKGGLLKLRKDKTVERIPSSFNIARIMVEGPSEIYCTHWGGLYLWNGIEFEKCIPESFGAVSKIDRITFLGTGPRRDTGDAIFYGPPFGPSIGVDLDPSYLDVPGR